MSFTRRRPLTFKAAIAANTIFFFLIGISYSKQALAQSTGNEVQIACRNSATRKTGSGSDLFMQGVCMGTIQALMNIGPRLDKKVSLCPPDKSTVGQGTQIVSKYLDANPDLLHFPFVILANVALQRAWPCKE